jgi:hypothetical protein
MAGSPFGPEVPPDLYLYADDGASLPSTGETPAAPSSSRGDAALQALAALAMLAPMGKGAKGLAAALGLGGGMMFASGAAGAAKKGSTAKKSAATEPPAAAAPPAAEPPPADTVKDEFTEEMTMLRQQAQQMGAQVERMGIQAGKGSHTLPTTQAELDKARAELKAVMGRIGEITKTRSDRVGAAEKERLGKEKAAENERKAKESSAQTNNYRLMGGGAGLGLGSLVAYLASRKLGKAVGSFEKTAGDISKMTGQKGNVLVSKGNVGHDLHAGVNDAYKTGGAKPPLPSLQPVYGAETPAALRKAKDEFMTGSKVPDELMGVRGMRKPVPNSPFVSARADKVAKGPAVMEKGLPIMFGGDAAGMMGASFLTDNPDERSFRQNMANFGLAGLLGFGAARKGLGFLASKAPNELARRAVESGKERVGRDVQSVQLKDLQAFGKNQGQVGVKALPKPKGEFKPGDAARMNELRGLKTTKGQARADFVSKAHMDDRIVQAHAGSIGPDGKVDRSKFRQALRQIYTATHDHNGEKLKMDDRMVAAIIKAFGSR